MSMSTSASFAETVTNEFVTKTCPEEMAGLLKVLAENEYDIDRLAMTSTFGGDIQGELEMDLDEDVALLILNTYDTLAMAFLGVTGLDLSIRHNEKDDRGDEVDGMFWEVDGVYELSVAGKMYKENITRKFWTNFG
jgi:hypothetical protein